LIELYDANPSIILDKAREKLCEHFKDFDISIAGLYIYIREKCSLSLKQATKSAQERDTQRAIELRFYIFSQWKAIDINFRENCVFVDEAGFHSQLMRSSA
jgi:cbb3-type cytochrome oxidase cytochrome c subunit